MQKVPTLFTRDPRHRRRITPEVTPGCEWVVQGEGRATRKWNGACVMLDHAGAWWARREVKPGKTPPSNYQSVRTDHHGRTVGWEPAFQASFALFHAEALANGAPTAPGTYELLGPQINGNADDFDGHVLMRHGWAPFSDRLRIENTPRDYDGLRTWLLNSPYKGIVWHRNPGQPDTEMAKLKTKDLPR